MDNWKIQVVALTFCALVQISHTSGVEEERRLSREWQDESLEASLSSPVATLMKRSKAFRFYGLMGKRSDPILRVPPSTVAPVFAVSPTATPAPNPSTSTNCLAGGTHVCGIYCSISKTKGTKKPMKMNRRNKGRTFVGLMGRSIYSGESLTRIIPSALTTSVDVSEEPHKQSSSEELIRILY